MANVLFQCVRITFVLSDTMASNVEDDEFLDDNDPYEVET